MKVWLQQVFAVGVAGFFGALARWGVTMLFGRFFFGRFPLGTFIVNVSGSFFLGWFLTFTRSRDVPPMLRLAIATGFVGAYTTFSTWIFDCAFLGEEGAKLESVANLVGSVLVGLVAVKLGMVAAQRP